MNAPRNDRSGARLVVLQVLVLSLLVTLFTRLWFLQVVAEPQLTAEATNNRIREVFTPAPRGAILDDLGRPFARNRTGLVVSVSRTELLRQRDAGRALIRRLAATLGLPAAEVDGKTKLCGTPRAPRPPTCWNGSPYAPIPIVEDADPRRALQILERREQFPGVTAELEPVRDYPGPDGAVAAHLLGYLGPVSESELNSPAGRDLQRNDVVGRAGLEKEYDADLRGRPGVTSLAVDHRGGVTNVVDSSEPVPGNYLVTNLDARVQAVAERELLAAIRRARTQGDPNKGGRRYKADSGAVVVLNVRTGGVVAMASWPSYDPNIWVGGISEKDYEAITSRKRNFPNQSRAFQGEFAPASTFKAVTLPGAIQSGYYSLNGNYSCPSAYRIGNSMKQNYESKGYGSLTLRRAIQVSCDTVFYRFAYEQWLRDGGNVPKKNPSDPMLRMAHGYLLGQKTGLDLPGERSGRIPDRQWKRDYWEATRDDACARKRTGYPEVKQDDPRRAAFLRQLARENCDDGWKYRAGDAANFAIGQGDTLLTPLQLASVYSAVANGGVLWEPHVAKAVVSPSGKVVRTIAPRSRGRIPVTDTMQKWLRQTLATVTTEGTGRGPFARANFPLDKIPVASKTGTGEVFGKQTTSWFASFAPADKPQYAIVMMVSQGGTGSGTSGPGVANIYKALFGVADDGSVDPRRAILPGGHPPAALPAVRPDGTVAVPAGTRFTLGAAPTIPARRERTS